MRSLHGLLLLCLAVPGAEAAAAQPSSFTPERVRAHVAFLADDLLEGRDTASRGHEIAARYVVAQFASYGLEPAGIDGYLQPVVLQKTVRGAERGTLTLSGNGASRSWTHASEVLVQPNPLQPHVDLDAALVFVGYGIEAPRFGIDDYRGLDVAGKVVVTLSGFPKGLPSEEGAYLDAEKSVVAQRHGAVGVIAIQTLQSARAFPWARTIESADRPRYNWVGADGRPHVRAPGIAASASLNTPAALAAFAGARTPLAKVLAEADRSSGRPRGFPLATRVRIRVDSDASRVTSPNVVGRLRGSDPALSRETVVLSGHLDHLGIAEAKSGEPAGADRIFNGALDNAAGIATMLEVARVAAADPARPRRSILFLASTGEERGLLGADYFAQHPTVPAASIIGNVDLDMPLLLYPFADVIAFGANHSSLGPIVADAVQPMGLALGRDPMPEQGLFTRSDHYMFVRQGVPAVFLATGYANGGEAAWNRFLSGAYHHADDDLQQPIDWQAGARFAEANYRITRAMADRDDPPRWMEGDFFGDVFAPGAARERRSPGTSAR